MKHILYIGKFNGIVGGIERYMQNSATLLRDHGFAVHYLYTDDGGRDQELFAKSFDSIQKLTPSDDLLKNADIIVIHNIIAVGYLKFIPANKTFFFAHDHNIYCQRHHYYTPVGRKNCHRKYNKFVCALCSLFRNAAPPLAEYRKFPALVLSDFMKDNLLKNGFEHIFKLPAFIKVSEKKHNFMPDGILRILFLGQLIRGKGADLMLKTLAKVEIPFTCTIAGDGNDRQMLANLVKKYRLQDKVHFTGFVSEPEKLWDNCDIFFFPIRWQEPFGLVVLEAMAHGIPVAAFDLGGVREHLTGTCGVLIPEKNIDFAARSLTGLYSQPEMLEEMGRNGQFLAEKNYSEKIFIQKFNELCEELK